MIDYPTFDGTQLCAESDPEAWFPDDQHLTTENRLAMRVCRSCEFVDPCLTYALHVRVEGIWGATTAPERERIRRREHITARPLLPFNPYFTTPHTTN